MKPLLLLAVLAHAPQEKLDASRHPWLRFKAGTSVAYKVTSEVGVLKEESQMTYSLKEIDEGGFTLEVKVAGIGKEQAMDGKEGPYLKVGEEKVRVAEKDHACTIWESKGQRGPYSTKTRYWLAEGIAVPLRLVSQVDAQESDVVATSLSEKLAIGGKEYDCVRLEGKTKNAQGEAETTVWLSDPVPGRLVKIAAKGKVQGAGMTTTVELAGVSEKK